MTAAEVWLKREMEAEEDRLRSALAVREADLREAVAALNAAVGKVYDASKAVAAEETLKRLKHWLPRETKG